MKGEKGKKVNTKEEKPSEIYDKYWLYAYRKKDEYPDPFNSGKWLIFVNIENLDLVWSKIKKATEEGLLGKISKVATAKSNPNARDVNVKVICVYTYDWEDEKDVMNIREELRKLGITNKISYKSDEDTSRGKYSKKGNKNIGKYYC